MISRKLCGGVRWCAWLEGAPVLPGIARPSFERDSTLRIYGAKDVAGLEHAALEVSRPEGAPRSSARGRPDVHSAETDARKLPMTSRRVVSRCSTKGPHTFVAHSKTSRQATPSSPRRRLACLHQWLERARSAWASPLNALVRHLAQTQFPFQIDSLVRLQSDSSLVGFA